MLTCPNYINSKGKIVSENSKDNCVLKLDKLSKTFLRFLKIFLQIFTGQISYKSPFNYDVKNQIKKPL
jgi:hypothetical protein